MRFFGLITILLLQALLLSAQREGIASIHWQRKVDPTLSRIVSAMASSTLQPLESTSNFQRLHLIIQAYDPTVVRDIDELGGTINTKIGELITVDLPAEKLPQVLALDQVIHAGFGPHLYPYNDRAKQHIGADQVQMGTGGLMTAYSGRGIVFGLIDDGIDVMHPDFRDPDDSTKSRIAYLWNQKPNSVNHPAGFSYGREYSRGEIELALQKNDPSLVHSENYDKFFGGGHGTVVAGSGVGNRGVAPEATIIAVALKNFSGSHVIDAAHYIIQKSEMMQLPCVINCSWGSYFPADGSGPLNQAYNGFMDSNSLVGFCAAAGNSGPVGVYWTSQLTNDTVYNGNMCAPTLFLRLNVLESDLDSLFVCVLVDSLLLSVSAPLFDYQYLKTTDTLGPLSFKELRKGFLLDTAYHDDQGMAGIVSISSGSVVVSKGQRFASFGIFINDLVDWIEFDDKGNVLDFFRIQIHGTGTFFGYFDGRLPSFTDPESKGFPSKHFLSTRNEYNVGPPAAASGVLAVGASTNRSNAVTLTGDTVLAQSMEGDLAWFSSGGVSTPERIKPEITAPGYLIRSSLSRRFLSEIGAFFKVAGVPPTIGDPQSPDLLWSGTSFSSPMAAGTVALIWQANPDLTFSEIRDIIISTAVTDQYTEAIEPTPNPQWGYGKINALAAVREAERLLDATSNTDFESHHIAVFPIPSSDEISIDLYQSDTKVYSMFLSDIQGKVLDYRHFPTAPKFLNHSIIDLPVGTYLITLITESGKLAKKIVKY